MNLFDRITKELKWHTKILEDPKLETQERKKFVAHLCLTTDFK